MNTFCVPSTVLNTWRAWPHLILFHLYPHSLLPSYIILMRIGEVIRDPVVWSMPGHPPLR